MKRSRLLAMELLERDYPDHVAWARDELGARLLPQSEIYRLFLERLGNDVPAVSFSAFNRWCMKVSSAQTILFKGADPVLQRLRAVVLEKIDAETLRHASLAIAARLRFLGGDA